MWGSRLGQGGQQQAASLLWAPPPFSGSLLAGRGRWEAAAGGISGRFLFSPSFLLHDHHPFFLISTLPTSLLHHLSLEGTYLSPFTWGNFY